MALTQRSFRPGFSLIELLVSIGVIGLLIAITTPSLLRARAGAMQTASLANCRTNWQAIEQWAAQNDDRYPRCLRGVAYGPPGGGGLMFGGDVRAAFETSEYWCFVIRNVAPFHEYRKAFRSPGPRHDEGGRDFIPSYSMSNSFVAQPQLWTPLVTDWSPVRLESLIVSPRVSDVVHPSGKVGLWDWERLYIPQRETRGDWKTPMAFADGHAAAHRISEATPGFPNILNGDSNSPLHNTPGGVQGRDY